MTEEKKEYELEMDDENDIQELREVLEVVSEKVPKLIKDIVNAIYSGQDAEEYGKIVAGFYKQMIEAGMDPEKAYALTEKFMESRDLPSLLTKLLEKEGGLNMMNVSMGSNVAKEIREEIKNKKEEK